MSKPAFVHDSESIAEGAAEETWVFRALDGPQQGAQSSLQAARYVIGSDEQICDIALIGEGVAPRHLDAVFADGRLTILRAQSGVLINGEPALTTPIDVEPHDIITIGVVSFTYGQPEGPWLSPQEVADQLAQARQPTADNDAHDDTHNDSPEENAATTDADGSADASAAESGATSGAVQAGAASSAEGAAVQARADPAQAPRSSAARTATTALALAAIAAVGASALALVIAPDAAPWSASIARAAPDEAPLETRVRAALASDPAFSELRYNPTQRRVYGHVPQEDVLNHLRVQLSGLPARIDVVSIDVARRSLAVVLSRYGPLVNAQLEPTANGAVHVAISGVLQSQESVDAFQRRIRQEMPYVTDLHVNVILRGDLEARAREVIASQPTLEGIRAHVDDSGLVINGTALDNFRHNLDDARQAVASMAPNNVPISVNVRFAPPFPARVVSLLDGPDPHARLDFPNNPRWNGVYRPQQPLPFGFALGAVRRDGVIVRARDVDAFLPLGGA